MEKKDGEKKMEKKSCLVTSKWKDKRFFPIMAIVSSSDVCDHSRLNSF